MTRIGVILVFCAFFTTGGIAASRVQSTSPTMRAATTTQRVKTKTVASRPSVRVATQKTSVRAAIPQTNTASRAKTNRTTTARTATVARATSDTRTGAEYEQCKTAYFACMDQFCQLKNDEYRRCSCSDRITSLQSARENLTRAGEQLTAFNENLDIVGKTAAQAAAMNTASDGELALMRDKSASAALLTAIMNSIRGDNSRVENNQLSDLNSIDLSFDAANSFGTSGVGQTIASYNGRALYSAVYPQCRTAVAANCNNASLQRAVNAYLMAIEQDCNTVQTAINTKQKETHAAIRESSSLLDMARAENHRTHNSDDIATCIANIESAIISEEVCGKNYHKCLDNGEYIDVATGAPIAGVVDFYKLGTMLTFSAGRNNAEQKLAQNPNNRTFVTNFEKRVKQFAEPALDKCYDDADTAWTDYLNKALLDIYYAQQSKVDEIKQGCFDFVSACYMNGSTAMTNAMQGLVAAQTTVLNPNILKLNSSLCSDYIASCNNMFDGNIVQDYIAHRHDTDSLTACRAVVQQCFDNYGGKNYENFYNPSSGLFASGDAPKWFSLYEYDAAGNKKSGYVSECAKQLAEIDACAENIDEVFGGFDYYPDAEIYQKYAYNDQSRLLRSTGIATEVYNQIIDILQTGCSNLDGAFMNIQNLGLYSANYRSTSFCTATFDDDDSRYKYLYLDYSIGKEITTPQYFGRLPISNNSGITITLSTTLQGSQPSNFLTSSTTTQYENMCPRDYNTNVDVQSWGACLCWENGGRRSNNGTTTRCVATFPAKPLVNYLVAGDTIEQMTTTGLNNECSISDNTSSNWYITDPNNYITDPNNPNNTTRTFTKWPYSGESTSPTEQDWCNANINNKNQVCPFGVHVDANGDCEQCPKGWSASNDTCCPSDYTYDGDTTNACCPSGYTYNRPGKNCCPSDYSFSSPNSTCGTSAKDAIPAQKTSSVLMGDNFPEG